MMNGPINIRFLKKHLGPLLGGILMVVIMMVRMPLSTRIFLKHLSEVKVKYDVFLCSAASLCAVRSNPRKQTYAFRRRDIARMTVIFVICYLYKQPSKNADFLCHLEVIWLRNKKFPMNLKMWEFSAVICIITFTISHIFLLTILQPLPISLLKFAGNC